MNDLKNINMQEVLTKSIILATEVHRNQQDKSGQPYILHPLRVMNNVDSIEAKIVGILHDVIEDGDVSEEYMINLGIPHVLVEAVRLLSRVQEEPYLEYVLRVKENPIAKAVKKADLEDNLNISRLTGFEILGLKDIHGEYITDENIIDFKLKPLINDGFLTDKDIKRYKKYIKAYKIINDN